jgi:hypothetical protein
MAVQNGTRSFGNCYGILIASDFSDTAMRGAESALQLVVQSASHLPTQATVTDQYCERNESLYAANQPIVANEFSISGIGLDQLCPQWNRQIPQRSRPAESGNDRHLKVHSDRF